LSRGAIPLAESAGVDRKQLEELGRLLETG
jgi:hypothetical protein